MGSIIGIKPENILYISFDDRKLLELVERNRLALFLEEQRKSKNGLIYVFVDEFQKASVTDDIKLLYENTKAYKFVLSGSASLAISKNVGESLLGRTRTFHLFPFTLGELVPKEVEARIDISSIRDLNLLVRNFFESPGETFGDLKKYYEDNPLLFDISRTVVKKYMLRGGYPKPALQESTNECFLCLKEVLNTYIEKDIIEDLRLGKIKEFRNTMEFLSHIASNILVFSNLSRDIGINIRTITKYISILEYTYITYLLPGYFSNKINSLKKSQKIFFLDNGLRNMLSDTLDYDLMIKDKGILLENLVFSQLYKFIHYFQNALSKVYFWRSPGKNELDFIIAHAKQLLPIEVSFTSTIGRGFRIFMEKEGLTEGIFITEKEFKLIQDKNLNVYFVPASVLIGI